jgi:gliding motility-associated protein GldM
MRRLIVFLLLFTTSISKSWTQEDNYDSLFNEIEVKVIFDKEFYLSGSIVQAEIILLGYQKNINYELTINGQTLKLKNNKAFYSVAVSGEGTGLIKGKVRYGKGYTYKTLKFEKEYTVAKGAAIFSLDGANTIYKGIGNPISIAVPSFPPHKVTVVATSAIILKKGSFNYLIKAKDGAEKVRINVSVIQNDNKVVGMGSAIFKVKKLPRLNLAIDRFETNNTVERDSLISAIKENPQLSVLENDEFPLSSIELNLKGFTFSIFKSKGKNPKPIKVQGSFITKDCISLLENISQGDKIIIDSIELNSSVEGVEANPLIISIK